MSEEVWTNEAGQYKISCGVAQSELFSIIGIQDILRFAKAQGLQKYTVENSEGESINKNDLPVRYDVVLKEYNANASEDEEGINPPSLFLKQEGNYIHLKFKEYERYYRQVYEDIQGYSMGLWNLGRVHDVFGCLVGFRSNLLRINKTKKSYGLHKITSSNFDFKGVRDLLKDNFNFKVNMYKNIRDLTDTEKQALIDICNLYFNSIFEEYKNNHLKNNLSIDCISHDIKNFRLQPDNILITKDGAYRITPLNQNIKSIKDYETIINHKNHITNKENLRVYKNELIKMKESLKQDKTELYIKAYDDVLKIFTNYPDWTLEKRQDGVYLCYNKRIYADRILWTNGKEYAIKKEYNKTFYVEGLMVKLETNVNFVKTKKSFHINTRTKENSELCLGTLRGKPLEYVLKNIIEVVKLLNHQSPWVSLDVLVDDRGSSSEVFNKYFNTKEVKNEVWGD